MMGEVSLNMELLVPLMEVGSDELEDFVIKEVCLFFTIIEFWAGRKLICKSDILYSNWQNLKNIYLWKANNNKKVSLKNYFFLHKQYPTNN